MNDELQMKALTDDARSAYDAGGSGHMTSVACGRASDIKHQTSNHKPEATNPKPQTRIPTLFLKALRLATVALFFLTAQQTAAQDRFTALETQLNALASSTVPGLSEPVKISVSGATLQEFIRGMAVANNLNINVDPNISVTIVNNFAGEKVMNILLFLCREYSLDLKFIGSIISITKYLPPALPEKPYEPKPVVVAYDAGGGLLTLDLRGDTLERVARAVTEKTGRNIILEKGLATQVVSAYLKDVPFGSALEKMAFSNGLAVEETDDGFFIIKKAETPAASSGSAPQKGKKNGPAPITGATPGLSISLHAAGSGDTLLDILAVDAPLGDVVMEASGKLGMKYQLFTELTGKVNLSVEQVGYRDLLDLLFRGTAYTYKKNGHAWLIGDRNAEGLRVTKMLPLRFRSVDKIEELIPADLKKGVEIKVFPEQNSLLLDGSWPDILELEAFITDIDKVVPVVLIELIIVDVNRKVTLSTGITVGKSETPPANQSIMPRINYTLSSETINQFLSILGTNGIINLGKVTPDFYINIDALETQGFIRKRSTPKLATLNGHEANMSIGATEYYLEEANNVIGTQNPQNIITKTWKSVNADLSITIKPMVSGDDHVTLEIAVKQSDFTSRVAPDAPPGSVTRSFKSLTRVKNGEMIVLGGLEEKSSSDTGEGTPYLSRIPILKWFFSKRTKADNKTRLNILIKPTVIY